MSTVTEREQRRSQRIAVRSLLHQVRVPGYTGDVIEAENDVVPGGRVVDDLDSVRSRSEQVHDKLAPIISSVIMADAQNVASEYAVTRTLAAAAVEAAATRSVYAQALVRAGRALYKTADIGYDADAKALVLAVKDNAEVVHPAVATFVGKIADGTITGRGVQGTPEDQRSVPPAVVLPLTRTLDGSPRSIRPQVVSSVGTSSTVSALSKMANRSRSSEKSTSTQMER